MYLFWVCKKAHLIFLVLQCFELLLYQLMLLNAAFTRLLWIATSIRIVSRQRKFCDKKRHLMQRSNRELFLALYPADWFERASFTTWYVTARSQESGWYGFTWLSNSIRSWRYTDLPSSSEQLCHCRDHRGANRFIAFPVSSATKGRAHVDESPKSIGST